MSVTHYVNRYTAPLVFRGRSFVPGEVIPAEVDAEQLARFAAQGIVEPTTAPADDLLRVPFVASTEEASWQHSS